MQTSTKLFLKELQMFVKKIIRMLSINPVGRKSRLREVLQVLCDNHIATGCDCGGENMIIIGVRKYKGRDDLFVSAYKTIGDGIVHFVMRAFNRGPFEIWSFAKQVFNPFFMNILCPPHIKQTGNCNLY